MATVHKEVSIEAAPAEVWAAVQDVGAVHERLVPGLVVATVLDGDVRTVTFANGLVVRERIVTVDEDARRLVYAATGGRATHHNASLQVLAEGPGRSRLVWITDLLPAEAAGPIAALVEQGAAIMKATLERGGRDAAPPP
jgi:carbon monoxide dehydrogenase subunit G